MEGATSVIKNIGKGWVSKTLKRKSKRTNIPPMSKQLEIHRWSAKTLKPENGFEILFSPEARASDRANSYEMEIINTNNHIQKIDSDDLRKEILQYYRLAKANGLYPRDFELYQQPDGRIALLDFDKYGKIDARKKTVTFPFEGEISLNTMPIEAIYSESLSKNIQSLMKGGRRKRAITRKNMKHV